MKKKVALVFGARALEMSPAEYMRERYDELGIETKQENIEMTM